MRKPFVSTALAVGLILTLAAPAAANDSKGHSFHATIDGGESGFVPGPFIPEGRCPPEAGWMYLTEGTGESNFGPFTYTSEHCSWIVTSTAHSTIGKLANGVMVFDFAEGQLTLDYDGSWEFTGDLMTGVGSAQVRAQYEVLDGTETFEGAKGHGQYGGEIDLGHVLFDLTGSLKTN